MKLFKIVALFCFVVNANLIFSQKSSIGLSLRSAPSSYTSGIVEFHLEQKLNNRSSLIMGLGTNFPDKGNTLIYSARIGYRFNLWKSKKIQVQTGLTYNPNILIGNISPNNDSYVSHDLVIPLSLQYKISDKFSVFADVGYSRQITDVFSTFKEYNKSSFRGGLGLKYNFGQ